MFIIDPIENLNWKRDGSMLFAENAEIYGNLVYFCESKDIFCLQNQPFCHARRLSIKSRLNKEYKILDEKKKYHINDFDMVFIRMNPPFDSAYLTVTQILSLADREKTLIANDPEVFQISSEKLLTLNFSEFIPETLITSDIKNVEEFLEIHQSIILKPINSFSSHDIYLIKKGDCNLRVIFENLLQKYQNCSIMIQRFINKVVKGDKRVLIVDGEVFGSFLRIPKSGSIQSGTVYGSSLELSELTLKEKIIIEKLKPFLKQRKIYFAGVDIIDEYLTEINFTSPTGIPILMELTGIDFGKILWKKFEEIYERVVIRGENDLC